MSVECATYVNRIGEMHPVPDNTQFPLVFPTLRATAENLALHSLRSPTDFMVGRAVG